MSNATADNRAHVLELIEGITSGQLLDKFEKFYAEDVVMSENGVDDPARHGKEANRGYETYFVNNSEWHGIKVGPVIADGDHTAYEMWMDFTIDGHRVTRTQWAVQTWKNGQIVREVFYYGA